MPLRHNVKEVELKNGAKGLIVDVPDASVFCYDFNFRAGNKYVKDPSIQQTAHLLEHLAFNGTKEYPTPEKFSQMFTENGAYNNAVTSEIGISYFGGSADFEAERILDLQGKSLTEMTFNEKSLAKEKTTVNEELTGQATNYMRVLWNSVIKSVGSPALNDEEKIKTLDNIKLNDIVEHYHRTHTTKNMRFVMGGNLNGARLDEMLAQIEKWNLPLGENFSIKQTIYKRADKSVKINNSKVNNTYFGLSMGINRDLSSNEEYALNALAHILTGTFHSRVFGKARQEGICYSVYSGGGPIYDGTSEFNMSAQVTPGNSARLYDLIIKELNNIINGGISEEDMNAVKRYSFGEYQQFGQTVAALTNRYAQFFLKENYIELDKVADIINSLSVDDVVNLTKEFVNTGLWSFGELGNINSKDNKKAYDKFSKELFKEGK